MNYYILIGFSKYGKSIRYAGRPTRLQAEELAKWYSSKYPKMRYCVMELSPTPGKERVSVHAST